MYYPEYNEGAVYQSTAPYYVGNYSGQQEPPVGFMNSPLVNDIANSFNMNRNAIYSNYGYSQQYIGYNQQPYGQYNQYGNGYYNPYYDTPPQQQQRRQEDNQTNPLLTIGGLLLASKGIDILSNHASKALIRGKEYTTSDNVAKVTKNMCINIFPIRLTPFLN